MPPLVRRIPVVLFSYQRTGGAESFAPLDGGAPRELVQAHLQHVG